MGIASSGSRKVTEYISEKKELVDSFFREYFSGNHIPAVLMESMQYSLFAGGKRIRPVLAIAAYEACGGSSEEVIPYAATLELVHTYSLMHDDLPAMDDDELRRGKPTNHIVFGEAIAILAGDALLTEAFSILSDTSYCRHIRESDLLKASRELSLAAGFRGMVAGQVQDILSENTDPEESILRFIHMHKTAALIAASVKMGYYLSGTVSDFLAPLTVFGEKTGLAFQIIDDVLDVEGDTATLGKTVGSDEKINKMTFPKLYGPGKSRQLAEDLVEDAVAALQAIPTGGQMLKELAYYLVRRSS